MLTLENVSVNYGAIEALTGISLHVEQGEVVTLIGANGAGKTTTLRTITGLLATTLGKDHFRRTKTSAVSQRTSWLRAAFRCRPKDAACLRISPCAKIFRWALI